MKGNVFVSSCPVDVSSKLRSDGLLAGSVLVWPSASCFLEAEVWKK